MEFSMYKNCLDWSDWAFLLTQNNKETMFTLGLVLDGLVYLTNYMNLQYQQQRVSCICVIQMHGMYNVT